jgi:hypothetical protein
MTRNQPCSEKLEKSPGVYIVSVTGKALFIWSSAAKLMELLVFTEILMPTFHEAWQFGQVLGIPEHCDKFRSHQWIHLWANGGQCEQDVHYKSPCSSLG